MKESIQASTAALKHARRLVRRLRRWTRRTATEVLYHPAYRSSPQRIMDPSRGEKVLGYLVREGLLSRSAVREPSSADMQTLCRAHELEYLEALDDDEVLLRIVGEHDISPEALVKQQRYMVGGTVMAARLAWATGARGLPVVNLGGGLHHAHREHGEGFCVFNDVAAAIYSLRADGFVGKVLVIDLDLHPGNGTRDIFARDESVFTFSLHATEWGEPPSAVADLSVELGPSLGDSAYLEALQHHLPIALEQSQPDLVFYLAGVDVASDDPLGSFRVSHDGILRRDKMVVSATSGLPLVWLLAGGYGPDAWRHTARSLAWLLGGRDAAIPSHSDLELQRLRGVARDLGPQDLSDSIDLTELRVEDVLPDFAGGRSRKRLLEYYTPYGIELAMQRYGVLDFFREVGFPRVRMEFHLDHSTGQMVRVVSDDRRKDLLLELVMRDTYEKGFKLVFVEWLLSQNPRRLPGARGLLPGQEHPGLGVGDKIMGMLLMACERLGYDGLAFAPAHLHVAHNARERAFFLDPQVEAHFLALRGLLSELGRRPASEALEQGRVIDEQSGQEVHWKPVTMVWPVSKSLVEWGQSEKYQAQVESAGRGLRYVLKESSHA